MMAVRPLLLSLLLIAPAAPAITRHQPVVVPPGAPRQVAATWQPPLSTRGRYIVDAGGVRFKLKSVDWHGASGTWTGSGDPADDAQNHAGENGHRIPLGLDRAPLADIVSSLQQIGVNSVRLPFSDEMIGDAVPVTDGAVRANPQLRGMTPLQVYDAVVAALTTAGLAVILNNHTNTTRWCCGVDGNERWNESQTTSQWEENWLFMARRYADNPRVVGADLYNEVRRDVWDDPNWGGGDDHDWFAASQHLGDRILREANPNLLIIVEGINWTGIPVDGFPHGRPTLTPARFLSHTLVASGKLVYSAHFYDYTGPHHSGATGVGETSDPRYRDLSRDDLYAALDDEAFFVEQPGRHFTAPLWISEFGVDGSAPEGSAARQWFVNFTDYLIRTDTDFAYWPAIGWAETRAGNNWALLFWDSAGNRTTADDWKAAIWARLIDAPSATGVIDPVPRWSMLSPDHGDFIQSSTLRDRPDWDAGARKAACPDGERLTGLAHTGNRGLCTDAPGTVTGYQVVTDERYVTTDWASGYTKFQCPDGAYLVGYAVRGAAMSSVMCAASAAATPGTGRTIWFDRGDNRPAGDPGGDFANGNYKGQCDPGEYAAGVAFTGRIGKSRTPDALYCRSDTKIAVPGNSRPRSGLH